MNLSTLRRLAFSCFMIAGVSLPGTCIDIKGKVTTSEGEPAFEVVVSHAGSGSSATSIYDGSYHLHDGQVNTIEEIRINHQGSSLSGSEARLLRLSPHSTSFPLPWSTSHDEMVYTARGRSLRHTLPYPAAGFCFRPIRGRGDRVMGNDAYAAVTADNEIVVSYQGTVLQKETVSSLNATLDIKLNDPLPERKHRLLIASYSNKGAYLISREGEVEWEYRGGEQIDGSCQDAWMLPSGNILLSGGRKVVEVTRSKEVVWEFVGTAGEIHNCQPLPNGGALFGENGTCRLVEVDNNGTIQKEIPLDLQGNNHTHFRMVRKTCDNTYLVSARGEENIYEYDQDGNELRKIAGETLKQSGVEWDAVHSAIKLKNGNIIIGGGYRSAFVEVDEDDEIVWKIDKDDLPDLGFSFAAAGQLTPAGSFIFAAYNSDTKIIEVVRETKEVIFTFTISDIGKPTHVHAYDYPGDVTKGEVFR